jgi:uncharacterized protein (TIGR01777 family)
VGRALVAAFRQRGYEVICIGRRRSGPADITWDELKREPGRLAGARAVVNLAGERIDQRWTKAAMVRLRESRIGTTALLARAAAAVEPRPAALLTGSAIGVYGDRGDEILDEASRPGVGFLAQLVLEWEAAAQEAVAAGIRVVHPRLGIVLHPEGGVLGRLLPIFRLGLGGPLGSGRQWMSWIARSDAVRALAWLALESSLEGPVNVVAPAPVTNAEFAATLGRVLGRPAALRIPAIAVLALYGQMGRETVLAGQRVLPRRLLESGFQFQHSNLESALRYELGLAGR